VLRDLERDALFQRLADAEANCKSRRCLMLHSALSALPSVHSTGDAELEMHLREETVTASLHKVANAESSHGTSKQQTVKQVFSLLVFPSTLLGCGVNS